MFLDGPLGEWRSGTCASLPVFYTAIGRRLGYPIKLVTTKAHQFMRWDDGEHRMNLEASGRGLSVYPDDYYRKWPFPMTAEEEQTGRFLRNLTPAEEVATFLQSRSSVLVTHKRFDEARAGIRHASQLAPQWTEIDGLFLRYVEFRQKGPPKPMLLERLDPTAEIEAAANRAMRCQIERGAIQPMPHSGGVVPMPYSVPTIPCQSK